MSHWRESADWNDRACDCRRCRMIAAPPARREIEPGLFLVSTAGSGVMPPGAIRDTVRALCESADREESDSGTK